MVHTFIGNTQLVQKVVAGNFPVQTTGGVGRTAGIEGLINVHGSTSF
jgi:hypothetical protein